MCQRAEVVSVACAKLDRQRARDSAPAYRPKLGVESKHAVVDVITRSFRVAAATTLMFTIDRSKRRAECGVSVRGVAHRDGVLAAALSKQLSSVTSK